MDVSRRAGRCPIMFTSYSVYVQRRETTGECAPYTRQAPTFMDINLVSLIVTVLPTAADIDLCEVMT